jgi:alpha-beta hydrolase superfamily lysophospholipase
MDQQGSTDYLNPNPLIKPHKHTSNSHFQNVDHQVEQLGLVVDDVLARTGLKKIFLLALSLGGSTVGKYLASDAGPDAGPLSHQAKVAGAIFVASTFRGAGGASATWPLGLIDRTDAMASFTNNNPQSSCPGREGAGIGDALWTAIQATDPVGVTWGPAGLSRYPVVPRFGWNDSATTKIAIPALIINGLNDAVVPVARSVQIFNSSPEQTPTVNWTSGAQCDAGYAFKPWPPDSDPVLPTRCRLDNRILMQLDCASHALLWETCSGDGCVDPHTSVQKRVGDWILTGK